MAALLLSFTAHRSAPRSVPPGRLRAASRARSRGRCRPRAVRRQHVSSRRGPENAAGVTKVLIQAYLVKIDNASLHLKFEDREPVSDLSITLDQSGIPVEQIS